MGDTVTCIACEAANPADAAFCMACGSTLRRSCPHCGAEAPAGARFCPDCGSALADDATAGAGPDEAADAEQRRTVTVLFADLSGYTAISERLDHETVKALVERCLTRLSEEVDRYGGRVDKYIGDNVMAVFGAPLAHEDDPARAVRAALAMQAAMGELAEELEAKLGLELALRVGVNTGEVLAGTIGGSYTVVGDAVNVAARLQASAPVGGVLVGERTRRLSAVDIVYRAVEPLTVKGKAEPVRAWEALSVTESQAQPGRQPSTPLIGREEELARLEATLDRVVRDGSSHLVTVIAQAGVGKSRLLTEFESRLARGASTLVLHGRCSAFGEGGLYRPLAEMLREACGVGAAEDAANARELLAARLLALLSEREGAEQAQRRLAPLMRLFGSPARGEESSEEEAEDQQSAREGFFGAVRAAVESLAGERTLVLAWEDIHWADEGTLDVIEYLARWLRAPVMQLCLARDALLERRPEWSVVRRTVSTTFLEPLPPGDAQRLVESLLVSAGARAEHPGQLAERSGGNPLFAEAMVQRIAEDGDGAEAQLPDTVHGLLAARLDSLDPHERALVADAAVLGRTFTEDALQPPAGQSREQLDATLAALLERGILVPGEGPGQGAQRRLSFKHVLIRDVAYEMLPKAARARRHAEVADLILERATGAGEDSAALVAEHYVRAVAYAAEAHLPAEQQQQLRAGALRHGEAAGDAAAALHSNHEALRHYQAAAELAGEDEEAAAQIAEKVGEMALRLGRVDTAIEAWERCLAHHDGRGDIEHVAELHRKIGAALAHKGDRKRAIEHHQQGINLIKDAEPSLTLVRLYEDAAWLYVHVGDNMLAIYAAEKALRLAETLGEARAASRAHGIFGRVFGRIGDAAKARENLERAVSLARESDAAETILALQALGHHFEQAEGELAAAGERYAEALALAERIGEVPAQIELQAALGQLALHTDDWDEVARAADASAGLAEAEGLVGKLCLANVLRGRLRRHEDRLEDARGLFETAHEQATQIGWSEVSLTALMGLASVLADAGDLVGARRTLLEACAVCDRAGLLPQSIQANAELAAVCLRAGEADAAREAASRAVEDAGRVRDPASVAAAREAEAVLGELAQA
ncbi:MAG TPA: adenylate/guanylate cyclase domain-containing protein [Solirubrobacteraceae bacterium]